MIVLLSAPTHQSTFGLDNDSEITILSLKRERDELRLQCVKLHSELESMKKTAECAINAISSKESKADENIMEEKKKEEVEDSANGFFSISALLEDMTRKMQIESEEIENEALLTLEFLKNLYTHKENEKKTILEQIDLLSSDIKQMEDRVAQYREKKNRKLQKSPTRTSPSALGKRKAFDRTFSEEETLVKKSKIFDSQFTSDLESAYFKTRTSSLNPQNALRTFTQHLTNVLPLFPSLFFPPGSVF